MSHLECLRLISDEIRNYRSDNGGLTYPELLNLLRRPQEYPGVDSIEISHWGGTTASISIGRGSTILHTHTVLSGVPEIESSPTIESEFFSRSSHV